MTDAWRDFRGPVPARGNAIPIRATSLRLLPNHIVIMERLLFSNPLVTFWNPGVLYGNRGSRRPTKDPSRLKLECEKTGGVPSRERKRFC